MVPSLEEPVQLNLSAPLMMTPKLVAPEPGMAYHKDPTRPAIP